MRLDLSRAGDFEVGIVGNDASTPGNQGGDGDGGGAKGAGH